MPGRSFCLRLCFMFSVAQAVSAAEIGHDPLAMSHQLSERGDRLFRAAHFDEAESAYLQAIDLDRSNIRGQLGMGRIAAMKSDRQSAARYYAAAYQINPLDSDAILGYANNIDDSHAQRTLLENFLSVARDARAEDVKARI